MSQVFPGWTIWRRSLHVTTPANEVKPNPKSQRIRTLTYLRNKKLAMTESICGKREYPNTLIVWRKEILALKSLLFKCKRTFAEKTINIKIIKTDSWFFEDSFNEVLGPDSKEANVQKIRVKIKGPQSS